MGKSTRKKEPSFEQALERLAAIVAELETGDLTLDDSLKRYEEGQQLIRRGYQLLEGAERRIEALLEGEEGKLEAKPFDPAREPDREETDG